MANIQHWLDQIRRAIYGREVRSSIADAIEAINKEQSHLDGAFDQLIINAGNSNAEIVAARVKADGTQFNTLGERLNKNDDDLLNLKNSFDEVNKEVIEARTDKAGVDHGRLKVRLDNIDEQLEQKANSDDLIYRTTKKTYIVIEGDSTAKGGTAGARWDLWLSMLLKRPVINNAVWGAWTKDVKGRLKKNVLDLHPEYCILLMGTNDIHGGENRRTSLKNYEDVIDELVNNAIKPIVCAVLPRNDFPADNGTIRIFNNCLLNMCQKKGVPFVDLYNPLANDDGTAKQYILHNNDNLHWSTYGAVLGAKEIAKAFKIYSQNNENYPHNLFKGDYPILENGIFSLDSDGDGLADHWTKIGTPTCSLIDNPNGGKYQVISKTSNTIASAGLKKEKFGGLTENAIYKLQCEYEFKLTDRTDLNANGFISLDFYNSSNVNIGSILVDEVWYSTGIEMTEIYKEFTPPAGTHRATLNFSCNATSPFTLKVGRAYINVIS